MQLQSPEERRSLLSEEEQRVFSVLDRYPNLSFSCKRITTILVRDGYLSDSSRSSIYRVQKILRGLGEMGRVDVIHLRTASRGSRYKKSVLFNGERRKGK